MVQWKCGWWAYAGATFMVAIIAYPLSLGPVYWLINHVGAPEWGQTCILVVYAPLGWVLDRVPEELSGWYTNYLAWCAHVNDPYGPHE